MYSQTDINDAVAGGALTQDQANSLRRFVAVRNGAPTGDEEYVRILLGFNDVFVTIACGFVLVAVAWLGTLIPLSIRGMGMGPIPIQSPFSALFVAAASWGLAELFTKKRHTALPSLLLTVAFAWGVSFFLLLLLASAGGMGGEGAVVIASLSFAAGAGAAYLHWKRFRVPIAIATIAGFVLLAIIMLMALGMRGSAEPMMILLLLAGIGIFLGAMWWDSQDPQRHSEKSDVAFWLHWLGGGLMVTSLAQLFGVSNGVDSIGGAIAILVAYAVLALIALIVNRKVYLVAGLSPLLPALQSLMSGGPRYPTYDNYGSSPYGSSPYMDPSSSPYASPGYGGSYPVRHYGSAYDSVQSTMLTYLILGAVLLVLAIYWAPVRRGLVGMLPQGLRAKVPATGAEPTEQANTFE